MNKRIRNHWGRETRKRYQVLVSYPDERDEKIESTGETKRLSSVSKLVEEMLKRFKKSFGDVAATLQGDLRQYVRYRSEENEVDGPYGNLNPRDIRVKAGKNFQGAASKKVRRGYLENDDAPPIAIDAILGIYDTIKELPTD